MNKQLTCAGSYYAPCVWFYLFRKGISQADTAAAARRRKPRLRRRAASRNSPGGRQARTAVLPLIDCRAAFPAIPNAGGDRRERTGALLKRASAFPDSAGAVKPVGRRKAVQKARPLILRAAAPVGTRNGAAVPHRGKRIPCVRIRGVVRKTARGTRSPSPRSPPKRVERSPLQTSRRNLPVTLSAQRRRRTASPRRRFGRPPRRRPAPYRGCNPQSG